MKGILEFDLEDNDDRFAHKRAVSATDAYLALLCIRESLPQYEGDDPGECKLTLDLFNEILYRYSINMNDLE